MDKRCNPKREKIKDRISIAVLVMLPLALFAQFVLFGVGDVRAANEDRNAAKIAQSQLLRQAIESGNIEELHEIPLHSSQALRHQNPTRLATPKDVLEGISVGRIGRDETNALYIREVAEYVLSIADIHTNKCWYAYHLGAMVNKQIEVNPSTPLLEYKEYLPINSNDLQECPYIEGRG